VLTSVSFDKESRFMPEDLHATALDRPAPYDAWLIVDQTAAAVLVPPSEAQDLYERFRNSGLPCSHLPGHCGADVIDFGNPSADQERLIRSVFATWKRDAGRREASPLWCVGMALFVIAVWFVALLVYG
jgi:hypothetical protein